MNEKWKKKKPKEKSCYRDHTTLSVSKLRNAWDRTVRSIRFDSLLRWMCFTSKSAAFHPSFARTVLNCVSRFASTHGTSACMHSSCALGICVFLLLVSTITRHNVGLISKPFHFTIDERYSTISHLVAWSVEPTLGSVPYPSVQLNPSHFKNPLLLSSTAFIASIVAVGHLPQRRYQQLQQLRERVTLATTPPCQRSVIGNR